MKVMRDWSLRSEDPLELTLACDARLVRPDFWDDQVWQISIRGNEPLAMDLYTTFGLRAQVFRMFPRFSEGEIQKTDPASYSETPIFTRLYPNYVKLKFSPFQDINVLGEYYVPDSRSIRLRYQITNNSNIQKYLVFEWVCLLKPIDGQSMTKSEFENVQALIGSSQGLSIMVTMSGEIQLISSPYPSIRKQIQLETNETKSVLINHSAQKKMEDGRKHKLWIGNHKWDAEVARCEMSNESWIEIYTGEPDWDIAFMLSQKMAHSLLFRRTSNPTMIIPIKIRQPDLGYSSETGIGAYSHSNIAPTPIETLYHISYLPPNEIHISKGWLLSFIAKQESDGFIHWKPETSEKKGRLLMPPILSYMAWQIYERCHDKSFLSDIFQPLLKFYTHWLSPVHDRDNDGIPEWDHPFQTGIEELSVYDSYQSLSSGQNINTLEMPSLCSFLLRECQALLSIANTIRNKKHTTYLEETTSILENTIEKLWSEQDGCYLARDRDSHFSPPGEFISQRHGVGSMLVNKTFQNPVRLIINIFRSGEATIKPHLIIYGASAGGHNRIEHILPERILWRINKGFATGGRLYSHIDQIDIHGITDTDRVEIISTNNRFVDISHLLPLWSGFSNKNQLEKLVSNTISNPDQFWRANGLPLCPKTDTDKEMDICHYVDFPFNTFVGMGLMDHGYHKLAADLTTKLMNAVIINLKFQNSFFRYYHAENGQGFGERNVVNGLAPLGLFLKTLGVVWISNKTINLQGFNPYPWPVTVKYQGTSILCQNERRTVTFPDGQILTIDSPEPCRISL